VRYDWFYQISDVTPDVGIYASVRMKLVHGGWDYPSVYPTI